MTSTDALAGARGLLEAGRLREAIEALNGVVRSRPTDGEARGFLVELLCVAGDLERADRQLEALSTQDPGAAVGVALWRQLVRAEQWRQQFFREGRLPEFLEVPDERLKLVLSASIHARAGEQEEAARLLAEAEGARAPLPGQADGAPFDDFRDLDDLVGGWFEVLTSTGKYYWIAQLRVKRLELHPPVRTRDLLWRRATIEVADGPEGEVFLPAIYVALEDSDEAARLGRKTDWLGGEAAPVRGQGLRTFLVGDEARTLFELGTLEFGSEG